MINEYLIIWNINLYDFKRLFSDIKEGKHNRFINQHYRKNQKILPNINDIVYIKNEGKILAKAIVLNNNLKYSSIIEDPYDKTKDFSKFEKSCCIQIIEIFDNPLRTENCNRIMTNWSKIKKKDFDL